MASVGAIRGAADQVADWVLVVCAWDAEALDDAATADLSDAALQTLGAAPGAVSQRFSLSYSALRSDVA